MRNILITGSKGQLGSELQVIAGEYPQFQYFFTDVDELDISDKDDLEKYIANNDIDAVVNCAAYTAVDAAEKDVETCYKVNRDAVRNIGETAAKYKIKVIHVSTDYVFDGTNHIPYTEDMPVSPTSVYGKSKLAGEEALMSACPDSVIIRTSWLYSSYGNNFVKTMMRLGRERDSLNVIFDQIGTPTYAADLAQAIMTVLTFKDWNPGIFHFSDEGVCSWYDFAKSIHRLAKIECNVNPIETKDYPVATPRPFYSVLNKAKIKSIYQIEIPHWEESLQRCIKLLANS
ncbi:dTDP-4-dehydrorhamnose reductase [Paludibacter sp. 221]|uniref:dTDP-4-dehydrorhamnose reductase n=1 Tax=Paludibacter sp. 221 TaxID=2302939 RepID=UPI0013D7BB25|nr:dTDP-4-dehydrorhamnose reductase [Paludibacter sp. 221]NDV45767.1 dTDP-4-dehydrorhamnose reductase [Paludibacter sp. 221]